MSRYTQGICGDGAAILRDGKQITIEQVLADLNAIYVSEEARCDVFAHRTGLALERAAEHLPEGWEIVVRVERNAGSVVLLADDGKGYDFDDADHECFAQQIEGAIDFAIAKDGGQ